MVALLVATTGLAEDQKVIAKQLPELVKLMLVYSELYKEFSAEFYSDSHSHTVLVSSSF